MTRESGLFARPRPDHQPAGSQLDFYPSRLALVERFVGVDHAGHPLGLGRDLDRVDPPARDMIE